MCEELRFFHALNRQGWQYTVPDREREEPEITVKRAKNTREMK